MEKAGWLGWPFSVASRGDCAIGIRKDQPGYTIDNYTINILCLSIVYPYVRVYSKSIHIYTHIIYDIYPYTLFLYTSVSSINMIIIYILFFKYIPRVFGPLMIPRLVEQTITSCSSWGEASLGDFSWRLRENCWFDLKLLNAITIVLKMWKDGSMSQFCTSCLWIAHILPTLYTPSCFNPAEYVYRSKQFQAYTYISS